MLQYQLFGQLLLRESAKLHLHKVPEPSYNLRHTVYQILTEVVKADKNEHHEEVCLLSVHY